MNPNSDYERPTTRERRLARAERREAWAVSRAAKADAAEAGVRQTAEHIPFGQPILEGHHSQRRAERDRDRIDAGMRRTVEHAEMAERHASRAANIRRAVDASIFDDDPDAVERLVEKLAALEAQRASIKETNAAFRRAHRAELREMSAYERDQALPFPAYVGQNLSGNISRTRARLERLRRARGVS